MAKAAIDLYSELGVPPEFRDDALVRILVRCIEQITRLAELTRSVAQMTRRLEFRDEILRAVIVFAHASLEDAIREALRRRWREWPDAAIAALPLQDRSNRIGPLDLKRYLGLTVEQFIENRVNEYLDKKSISSASELCNQLKCIDIDLEALLTAMADSLKDMGVRNANLGAIQTMIERRHNIVHNGDYDRETHARNSIEIESVADWLFIVALCALIVINSEAERHPGFPIVSGPVAKFLVDLLFVGKTAPTSEEST